MPWIPNTPPQDHEGQDQIGRRPGKHDDELLPALLLIHQPPVVLGLDVFPFRGPGVLDQRHHRVGVPADLAVLRRVHPDQLDVTAQRERLQAVLGLAAPERPQRLAEPDEVLGDLHPEDLGRDHVPELVQRDRQHDQGEEHDRPPDDVDHGVQRCLLGADVRGACASPRIGRQDVIDGHPIGAHQPRSPGGACSIIRRHRPVPDFRRWPHARPGLARWCRRCRGS